jgi:phosphoserine phosphatase RsbU/P
MILSDIKDYKAVIESEVGALRVLLAGFNKYVLDNDVSTDIIYDLETALCEGVINIIKYAEGAKEIVVTCGIMGNQVVIEIKDEGVAFNPLEYPEPDISLPLYQRSDGGLGIYLIKKLVDSVWYERKHDSNILTLVKKLTL